MTATGRLHLVGHDGTGHGDDALALARTVGTGRDVRRTIVHVISSPGTTAPAAEAWIDMLGTRTRDRVARIAGVLAGGESLVVLAARSPARGLHDYAETHAADLIAVGAHRRTSARLHFSTGTVAAALLSGGPCRIAHAPEGYAATARHLERIVVGFDGSAEAHEALSEAAALAAASGALVDVVHVYDHTAFPRYAGTVAEAESAGDEIARDGSAALPEAVRGVSASRSGNAGTVIQRFAEAQRADLVVLGSRGFGPVCRALLGSTSSQVLHATDRPVVIVPRGAAPESEPPAVSATASHAVHA